jgi:flagellar biosynthesis anti-sigma factor FlgM
MDTQMNPAPARRPNPADATPPASRVKATPAADTQSARETGDTANLSQTSELVAQAINQPQIRTEKVEAIKAQIEAGTYKVDAAEVADALINAAMKR